MVYGNSQNIVQHACECDMEFSRYAFAGMGRNVYWVGTNGLMSKRVTNLDTQVLLQDDTNIEDLETTIFLWNNGYHVAMWNDLVLAVSIGPKSMAGYVVQRERWFIGPLNLLSKIFCRPKVTNALFKSVFIFVPSFMIYTYVLFTYLVWHQISLHFSYLYFTLAFAAFTLYLMARKRASIVPVVAVALTWCMLIPVVFVATLKSLFNCISFRKVSFIRTPRTDDYTTIGLPWTYIFLYLTMLTAAFVCVLLELLQELQDDESNAFWNTFISFKGFYFFTTLFAIIAIIFADPYCHAASKNEVFTSFRDTQLAQSQIKSFVGSKASHSRSVSFAAVGSKSFVSS